MTRLICNAILIGLLGGLPAPSYTQGTGDKAPLVIDGLRLINGTQLYCKSVGTGTPVLIIHGGPGLDHSYFLPHMEKLADSYELIFFDQRGCGRSTIRVDSASMTLDALIEDIDRVRDAYNLQTVNLMGHSWGGLLAMFYAIRHGDRLNSLILVNSTPPTSALRDSAFRIMAARTTPDDSAREAAIARSAAFLRRDPGAVREYFRLLFRGTFRNPHDEDELNLTFPPDYAERSALLKYLARDTSLMNYDLLSGLESITCPVLIIGSDCDMTPRESNEAIHSRIRDSQLVIMKDCGHFPFIEAPSQFFPAVRTFLRKVQDR